MHIYKCTENDHFFCTSFFSYHFMNILLIKNIKYVTHIHREREIGTKIHMIFVILKCNVKDSFLMNLIGIS